MSRRNSGHLKRNLSHFTETKKDFKIETEENHLEVRPKRRTINKPRKRTQYIFFFFFYISTFFNILFEKKRIQLNLNEIDTYKGYIKNKLQI